MPKSCVRICRRSPRRQNHDSIIHCWRMQSPKNCNRSFGNSLSILVFSSDSNNNTIREEVRCKVADLLWCWLNIELVLCLNLLIWICTYSLFSPFWHTLLYSVRCTIKMRVDNTVELQNNRQPPHQRQKVQYSGLSAILGPLSYFIIIMVSRSKSVILDLSPIFGHW